MQLKLQGQIEEVRDRLHMTALPWISASAWFVSSNEIEAVRIFQAKIMFRVCQTRRTPATCAGRLPRIIQEAARDCGFCLR